jgi:hypothetical protein
MEKSLVKKVRHPSEYGVFQPNVLIGQNNDFNLLETRVYTIILSFNHKNEPDRLIYPVPMELVSGAISLENLQKVANQEVARISDSLQRRSFKLDKEFMKINFGSNVPISINPFPQIEYRDMELHVHLQAAFKKILIQLELGFTKGEKELLLSFNHSVSHRLYWIIRSTQWKFNGNRLEFELEELKLKLGLEGQYNDRFDNFRSRVLDPIKEEFKGSYVEFDYEPVRQGKKVVGLTFMFNSDFEQDLTLRMKSPRKWEKMLSDKGIKEIDITRMRYNVIHKIEIIEGSDSYWDDFYIETVYALSFDKYTESIKSTKGSTKIHNFANFLYTALTKGWWLDEVAYKRNEKNKKIPVNQTSIFNHQSKPRQYLTCSIEQMQQLFDDAKGQYKGRSRLTLDEFAQELNYTFIAEKKLFEKQV